MNRGPYSPVVIAAQLRRAADGTRCFDNRLPCSKSLANVARGPSRLAAGHAGLLGIVASVDAQGSF
jgi:hypothetical protein